MTRFARAKGSKASNERIPETATPWAEIKEQLLSKRQEQQEQCQRNEIMKQRNSNYKAFLDEKEKEESQNVKWADFPDGNQTKIESDDEPPQEASIKMIPQAILIKVKKSKRTPLKISTPNANGIVKKKTKKQKLASAKIERTDVAEVLADSKLQSTENAKILSEAEKTKIEKKKQRRRKQLEKKLNCKIEQKEKSKRLQQTAEVEEKKISEDDLKKIGHKKQKKIKQLLKKKQFKELKNQQEAKSDEAGEVNVEQISLEKDSNNSPRSLKTKLSKASSGDLKKKFQQKSPGTKKKNKSAEYVRSKVKTKEITDKWIINGKEVLVEYFDGFPIKKDDAERLKQLRKQMISKGLPRSEINFAMKLERRKAEKAFAREKKKVCFNCRRSGHNLSECPELDKGQIASTGTGICFKCGSTEHTHFECKVVRGENFKYAECFICKEQGHIAKQCPDNARGLYPKGGSCNVCGDVTHLKKDCPKYQAQQQQLSQSLNLSVFDGGNPDNFDDSRGNFKAPTVNKKPNKIIKFS